MKLLTRLFPFRLAFAFAHPSFSRPVISSIQHFQSARRFCMAYKSSEVRRWLWIRSNYVARLSSDVVIARQATTAPCDVLYKYQLR